MGGDGGSIPTRADLVRYREKKRELDPNLAARLGWNFCTMTAQPLREPLVADDLGNIYNKESILNYLLSKKHDPAYAHIRSLHDVVTLQLTPNPSLTEADKKEIGKDDQSRLFFRWICPVTLIETNGKSRFCVLRSCGCVLSDKALREVPSTRCLRCQKPYQPEQIIGLVLSAAEQDELKRKLELKRGQEVVEKKKDKKEKEQEKKKEKQQDKEAANGTSELSHGKKRAAASVVSGSESGEHKRLKPIEKEQ